MPLKDPEALHRTARDAAWEEDKHPRGKGGRFGSGGGTAGLKQHPVGAMREYTPKELDWEYETEYKKYSHHFAPTAFKDRADFQEKYDAAPLRHLTPAELGDLQNTSGLTSMAGSGGTPEEKERELRDIIGEHRRDVGRVLRDLDEGETAPPIVLRKGGELRLMAGNTRLMAGAARGLSVPAKVIDVPDDEKKRDARDVAMDEGWYCVGPKGDPIGPFATQAIADRVSGLLTRPLPAGLAFDRSAVRFSTGEGGERRIAFDRESVRFETIDGHMQVKRAPISKATVNPYKGSEIPGCEELGLDPEKVYMLLRDPGELAKAAPTFAGMPLLIEHIPVSADEHPTNEVVGAVGTEVEFAAPYLMAPLTVWTREAIEAIEDGSQRELSSGYHYVPVMKPGTYQGKRYDGVMTQIKGNHVALVQKGRAGPDVVIGDSARPTNRKEKKMPKPTPLKSRTAIRLQAGLGAYLFPMLANDAKLDLTPIVAKVTRKGCMAKDGKTIKKGVVATIAKLALDAAEPLMTPEAKEAMPGAGGGGIGPDDVIYKLIEHIIENKMGGAPEAEAAVPELENDALEPNAAATPADGGGGEEDPAEKKRKAIMDACMGKGMSEDDATEIAGMMAGPEGAEDGLVDNTDKDNDGKVNGGKGARDKHPTMDKKAMDAAIELRVKNFKADMVAANEARAAVEPFVGKVSMALDSAAGIYKASLKTLGVDAAGVDDVGALKLIFAQTTKAASKQKLAADELGDDMALDSETHQSLAERFPHAASIRVS